LVIGIDFDGTIVTEQWPKIGRLRWLAKKRINWMQHKRKHILVLVTCREGELLEQADRFLMDHGIDFLEEYLNYRTEEGFAFNTVSGYQTDLKQFFDFYTGEMEELVTKNVESWKVELLSKRLKPKTVNRKLVALSTFIKWINNQDY
jgi:hypothetical protein